MMSSKVVILSVSRKAFPASSAFTASFLWRSELRALTDLFFGRCFER